MVLSDQDIIAAIEEERIELFPFHKDHVQPASVDLTLASRIRLFDITGLDYIDVKNKIDPTLVVDFEEPGYFLIEPGDFVLGSTNEKISLPANLMGRVDGRSSLGRLGLVVQMSASHISPGFSGTITLEIINLSSCSIKLYAGMRIAQITFETLSSTALFPYGSSGSGHKYQGQSQPASSKIWQDFSDH
jgi:dCTP deaminase